MKAMSPELQKALSELPGNFNSYQIDSTERFRGIEKRLEEATEVDLINGDGKKVKIAKIIPAMHKDIKDIKASIADLNDIKKNTMGLLEMVTDFSKVHFIFKKYKMYHAILLAVIILSGMSAWDFMVEIFKSVIK